MTPRLTESVNMCSTLREIHARSHRKHMQRAQEALLRRRRLILTRGFFVGKYFVVRLSTTKTTKIVPPEKYPLYGMFRSISNESFNYASLQPRHVGGAECLYSAHAHM